MVHGEKAAGSGAEHEPIPETSAPGGLPAVEPGSSAAESPGATQNDPINKPRHYVGRSGLEVIEITHAYRLGPDLTQAVQYILRAGRKTRDPREDLRKAAFYCRYAARQPMAMRIMPGGISPAAPTPEEIARDFDLSPKLELALLLLLDVWPAVGNMQSAAGICDELSSAWQPPAEVGA